VELTHFRESFPILDRVTWLATPSVAPAARPVSAVLQRALEVWIEGEVRWSEYDTLAQRTRRQFARLLGAGIDQSSVALLQSVA